MTTRRSFSTQEKMEILNEGMQPGTTAVEVCRKHEESKMVIIKLVLVNEIEILDLISVVIVTPTSCNVANG